jgi:ABC-2 type transport system permease protein
MEINKNIIEVELGKLYAIWLREFKVFLREKSRLIASIFTPLMWLFIIGSGLGSAVSNPSALSTAGEVGSEIDYQQFIFPGVICMSVIFSPLLAEQRSLLERHLEV